MRLVVDASTLVAELLRQRGRRLFAHPDLQLLVAEDAWEETERGLEERAVALRQRVGAGPVEELLELAREVVRREFVVVPRDLYSSHEAVARGRLRDPSDWPTVALALVTGAAILTADPDFLGAGIATWTYDTLAAELEREGD